MIIQNKIDQMTKLGNKDVGNLINKRDKYYHNHELRAALAVDLLNVNDDGYLAEQKTQSCIVNKDGLIPLNQASVQIPISPIWLPETCDE